jgi:hypothetical protein
MTSESEEMDTRTADANASSSELQQVFSKVLDELPDAQREALVYNVYKGLSQREIAARPAFRWARSRPASSWPSARYARPFSPRGVARSGCAC